MSSNRNDSKNRREFLLSALQISGQVVLATSATYAISVLSKNKIGNMVAGAKSCYWAGITHCSSGDPDPPSGTCDLASKGALIIEDCWFNGVQTGSFERYRCMCN